MTKPKILHLIQSLDSGGCENFLLRALPLMKTFDHRVITIKNEGALAPMFKKKGIPIEKKNHLFKQIKEYHPDLIITYLFHADAIGRLMVQPLTGHKVIPFLRTTYNHPLYWLARMFENATKGLVPQYLANSKAVKDFYVKNIGVAPEKITIVPNGIDINKFQSIKIELGYHQKLGIYKKNAILVCVANLAPNKGHKYLLEAFEKIYTVNQKIQLLLVGDGTEKQNLVRQINDYKSKNNIIFFGNRDDIPKILKVSDIFILPTLFEGMSNALLEAAASGLPIITTDIAENRVLLKNALFVPVKNSGKICQAIIKLGSQPKLRKSLAQAVLAETKQKFILSKSAKLWTAFINQSL